MPTKPPSPCTYPGCPKLVHGRGSRCREHRYEAARPSSYQRGYAGRRWQTLRDIVIERDGGSCQECGRPGRQVAHIHDRRLGGADDPDNLRLLCDSCHSRETALETRFGQPDKERFIRLFNEAKERVYHCKHCEGNPFVFSALRPTFSPREMEEIFSGRTEGVIGAPAGPAL